MATKVNRRKLLAMGGTLILGTVCTACLGNTTTSDGSETSSSGTRCPHGLTNDPYPGKCRMYVDSNDSGYCDYSEA